MHLNEVKYQLIVCTIMSTSFQPNARKEMIVQFSLFHAVHIDFSS